MTPELAAILVLILANLGGLASILRLQSERRELQECLQWAEVFALSSQEADATIRNPKFDEWLVRCSQVSGYPYGKGGE